MPQGDDYTPTTSGTLKLKGVKASKVEKHKKKRKRPAADDLSVKPTLSNSKKKDKEDNGDDGIRGVKKKRNEEGKSEREEMIDEALAEEMGIEEARGNNDEDGEERITGAGKTEAERRHDESRRKRLDERLKREGIKTHKERVEELNRYLSNLSEHHDMPRIGPG